MNRKASAILAVWVLTITTLVAYQGKADFTFGEPINMKATVPVMRSLFVK